MIKRLKQFQKLSINEKKVLCLSMLSLPIIAVLLHTLGFNKTKSFLSRFIPVETSLRVPQKEEMLEIYSIANSIHIASRHNIYKANCLKQALLLWFVLGRKSIYSEIKIGIQKEDESTFGAHAWVECNGEPLIDSQDTIENFSTFKNFSE